jgi:cytochrome P450
VLNLSRVITQPKDVKTFFFDSHTHRKAASSNAGWLFSQVLGECLGLINGERWIQVRHAFDPFFTRTISAQRLPHIMSAGESYMQDIAQYHLGKESASATIVLNAVDAFQRFPFFYVAEIIYGPLQMTEQAALWKLAETHTEIFKHLVRGGIHRYRVTKFLSTVTYKKTAHFVKAWREFNIELTQKQLRDGRTSSLTHLMAGVEEGKVTLDEVSGTSVQISRVS